MFHCVLVCVVGLCLCLFRVVVCVAYLFVFVLIDDLTLGGLHPPIVRVCASLSVCTGLVMDNKSFSMIARKENLHSQVLKQNSVTLVCMHRRLSRMLLLLG